MIDEIHIFLSNIWWTFRYTLFRNRKIFNTIRPYLSKGTFRNSIHCDYIYEVSRKRHFEKITFASFSYQNPIAKIIIAFVTNIIRYKNRNGGGFGGTEIIVSSSHQEYKVFNIEKKKVLTLYSDPDKLNRILGNKRIFENTFDVAKTIEVNKKDTYCVEEYIEQNLFDKEKAFQYIADQYAEYAKNASCCKDEKIDDRCKYFALRFGKSDLLNLIKDYPMIFSHGDLWRSNVMYDGSRYYITDFEAAKSRFILYDLFCFIFTEYVLYNEPSMIQCYFQGKYDNLFSQVLQSVNI